MRSRFGLRRTDPFPDGLDDASWRGTLEDEDWWLTALHEELGYTPGASDESGAGEVTGGPDPLEDTHGPAGRDLGLDRLNLTLVSLSHAISGVAQRLDVVEDILRTLAARPAVEREGLIEQVRAVVSDELDGRRPRPPSDPEPAVVAALSAVSRRLAGLEEALILAGEEPATADEGVPVRDPQWPRTARAKGLHRRRHHG